MSQLHTQHEEEDEQKDKYLTFNLGEESYGIEIRYVIEIVGIQDITVVPEVPQYIKGIINLRGQIIPVMDVRLRFKKLFQQYNDRTCIIVVQIQHIVIGLIVDKVAEVVSIPLSNIVPPPEYTQISNQYIQGIGKLNDEVMLLLDCNKLIHDQDATLIEQIL
ncbi:MAG: chemotaxis protein CheW [Candidatus Pristimantibacillus lignocellulolyticus]|uniref:Chemotaxis protein CheW n=1 Tax=Candidatus Pristimantibacillus lignocellulolyticus TaxID=2994561 RepID=A0A9J6ZFQ7_9BACL|nr:MAG: chemotaxis protein CheW [Candidatus Pristimantibacillus lignocellulolyticus]